MRLVLFPLILMAHAITKFTRVGAVSTKEAETQVVLANLHCLLMRLLSSVSICLNIFKLRLCF